MTSLSCISDAKINCCKNGNCKDDMCPDTHHCCWQKTENPLLGLCVKKDSRGGTKNCDKKRGLPISSCRDTGNRNRENYEEHYEDNNKNLSKSVYYLFYSLYSAPNNLSKSCFFNLEASELVVSPSSTATLLNFGNCNFL